MWFKSFRGLKAACQAFCDAVNSCIHRATRPVERLPEERRRLYPLPGRPFTADFRTTRRANRESTISAEGVRHSVPHELIGNRVWARFPSRPGLFAALQAAPAAVPAAAAQ